MVKGKQDDEKPVEDLQPSLGARIRQKTGRTIELKDDDPYLSLLSLLPLAGVGLLVYSLIQYGNALIPPRLTDPAWEMLTLYAIGETSINTLIAFVLIFSFKWGPVNVWRLLIMYRMSWSCIFIGIFLLGLIPLGVFDTVRLYSVLDEGYKQAVTVQDRDWVRTKRYIENARDEERIETISTHLRLGGVYDARVRDNPTDSLLDRKNWLIAASRHEFDKLRDQLNLNHKGEVTQLYKRSLRTSLVLLLDGILFIILWSKTAWLRHLYISRGEIAPHLNE